MFCIHSSRHTIYTRGEESGSAGGRALPLPAHAPRRAPGQRVRHEDSASLRVRTAGEIKPMIPSEKGWGVADCAWEVDEEVVHSTLTGS